jgi:formylglycine-generating enzyme required for sulfatase activity
MTGTGGVGGGPPYDAATPDVAPVKLDAPPPQQICTPNQATCTGAQQREVCSADGLSMTTESCGGATPYCVGGKCVACFSDSHCANPGACKKVACSQATSTCMVTSAPGLPCTGGGSCSATGVCRRPISLGNFSVDATEVTKGQYAEFLTAKGNDTSGQPSYCSFNTTYLPEYEWPPQGDEAALPANWIDWCDALAYCKWAGKRLCGKIGGGATPHDNYDKASDSQWHAACSAGGTKKFPYGNTFDSSKCAGPAPGRDAPLPAGSFPGCEGGYPGIFDMSANVWEWEDGCIAYGGKDDLCRVRGGSYYGNDGIAGMPGIFIQCNANNNNPRDTTDRTIGFRCCSP